MKQLLPRAIGLLKTNKIGLSVIFLTWLIFFSRTLFAGQIYFIDDLKNIYYPLEHVYAQFQHQWQLPQWSNVFGFGQPLMAWGQLGFFTPLHVLLRTFRLHPIILLQISILVYFAVGLVGMFAFLRRRQLGQLAAALGAIIFVFSGWHVGHLNHVNFYTATMLLPWLLLTIDLFVTKPTLARTAILALVAATIPMSGQPQVALYTLIIGVIFGVIRFAGMARAKRYEINKNRRRTSAFELVMPAGRFLFQRSIIKTLALTVLAASLFAAIASFAVLPLLEFLPSTDRSADLPTPELYEFSYPPSHAITLLFPYFYGDHEVYWGAKSFRELAAYTGIIPLLLAGLAITSWKKWPADLVFGSLLFVSGIVFMLGSYSPLYRLMVESHWLSSITVPGRFVYFVDVGIAILAAIGLEQTASPKELPRLSRAIGWLAGVVLAVILVLPFFLQIITAPGSVDLNEQGNFSLAAGWLIVIGFAVFTATLFLQNTRFGQTWLPLLILVTSAGTLLFYGWNYNPLVPRAAALAEPVFAPALQSYARDTGLPARLYASDALAVAESERANSRLTEPVSAKLTLHQPIIWSQHTTCLLFPVQIGQSEPGSLRISLRTGWDEQPLYEKTLHTKQVPKNNVLPICPNVTIADNTALLLTFASEDTSNIRFTYRPADQPEQYAYFVRVAGATPAQLEGSVKPFKLVWDSEDVASIDIEKDLMLRHMQATSGLSSGRWIGALGIGPYREFIETFLANDREAFGVEGIRALAGNREIINLAGITHLTQIVPDNADDPMIEAGYEPVEEKTVGSKRLRLYKNPQAYPKAFMVRNAMFEPAADDTRRALLSGEFRPDQLLLFNGETPPAQIPEHSFAPLLAKSNIVRYEPTRIDIATSSREDAWLVVTDSTTPQWLTFIDDKPALSLSAFSVFKAALVPAGDHMVSFRYFSPAVESAKVLTIAGLLVCALLCTASLIGARQTKSA